MSRLHLALLSGLAALAPSFLCAQVSVVTERSVTGVLVDSISGKTVRGAVLYLDGARVEFYSGRDGRFTIQHASIGDTLLVVRGIGYVPSLMVVPSSASASVVDVGRVLLRPVATTLDQIAVEAEEVRTYPHLEDFYRRKQQGMTGDFITREDIEKTGARKTSALLSRSAKVFMDCPHDAVKTGDENCAARDRRGMIGGFRRLDGGTSGCEKQLFVDGKRSMLGVDEIPTEQIAALEIYAGPATTPANFGAPPCGVVVIWTKGANRD